MSCDTMKNVETLICVDVFLYDVMWETNPLQTNGRAKVIYLKCYKYWKGATIRVVRKWAGFAVYKLGRKSHWRNGVVDTFGPSNPQISENTVL